MPLVRIAVSGGKTDGYRDAISRGVQAALVETFSVPPDDLFQIITEHAPGIQLVHPKSYLGIEYSDDFIVVQLTVSDTRTLEQKKHLFTRIAERLSGNPGLRPQDVFINLVEVKKENWSFGNGVAQYA
jgi:phenylpyruvate tautomerase PptA (4-oxalocrotonate tautomerase family)